MSTFPKFRSHFSVTKSQLELVNQATQSLNDGTRWIFCHLVYCSFRVKDRNGWYPIHWRSAQNWSKTKGFDHDQLISTGIVEDRDPNYERQRSREYKIKEEWLEAFTRNGLPDSHSLLDDATEWFNVFTQVPIKKRIGRKPKPILEPSPNIADDAAKALSFCYLNIPALDEYRNLTIPAYERLLSDPSIDDEAKKAFRGKYKNLGFCLGFILATDMEPTDRPGIYRVVFRNERYEVQDFGRLYLPLQQAPRVMKHFMYQGTGLSNYDVHSCHPRIVLHQLKTLNLPHCNLVGYISNKEEVIALSSLQEETFKPCLMALLNGAGLPRNLYMTRESNAIRRNIEKEVKGKKEVAKAYSQFRKAIKPIYDEVYQWLQYLSDDYINNPENLTRAGSGLYVTNAVGMKLDVSHLRKSPLSVEQKARELACFILQGYEAAFIHKLTLIGPHYGFQAVGNEHDGLITLGKIPAKAIEEAQRFVGIDLPLREKPFCGEEEIEDWRSETARPFVESSSHEHGSRPRLFS